MIIFSRGKGNIVYRLSRTWCDFTTFSSYFHLFSRNYKFAFLLNPLTLLRSREDSNSKFKRNKLQIVPRSRTPLSCSPQKNREPEKKSNSFYNFFVNKSTEETFHEEVWKNDLNILETFLKTVTGWRDTQNWFYKIL